MKNSTDITIRKATQEDAAGIIAYLNQIGGESDNLLFGKDAFKDMPIDREQHFISMTNSSNNSIMLVAIAGETGEVVSVCSLQGNSRQRIAHKAEIAISVRKDYWGMHIASRMIETIIEFAKTVGITIIELEVKSDNEGAIGLYKKYGFEKFGTYKKYFNINGKYYDADYMNLYL